MTYLSCSLVVTIVEVAISHPLVVLRIVLTSAPRKLQKKFTSSEVGGGGEGGREEGREGGRRGGREGGRIGGREARGWLNIVNTPNNLHEESYGKLAGLFRYTM